MAETINTQTTGCVGIEKIEQTYEGLFDNKPNIITIYLTNGDTHQFKVMNGSQGVGIDRIEQRQSSTVSGGRNEFAIILTNGKEYTFSTYNGSGGSGASGSFNQVLQHLNNLLMPSGKSYLYYNGSGFEWKSPDGSTGGGTADLSEYSWWGRKFDPASKSITGEMSGVTGIEFQSTNGETVIRKKLHLDKNGDLCFDGNLYATGGITALGVGTTTGGSGSGASLGTLLTKLNSENPFPTANGQVLTYDGSNFVWKTSTGSGGGGSSSSRYPFTIYNGSSNTDYITYDGSSSAYLKFKSGFSISKVGLGYEISVSGGSGVVLSPVMDAMNRGLTKTSYGTPQFLYWDGSKYTWKNESEISGGGSGSSGRIDTIKLFNDLGNEFDSVNLGSGNAIGFMQGDNVTLQAVVKDHINVIKISAKGGNSGSGGSTSTSVSWSDVTNKPSTFTPSSHTHSPSDINGLSNYVQGTKVSNATNADKATQLANSRTIWGQSFNGTGDINGNLYIGTAGGGSIQLYMNNGNMLDRTNNVLHIGYALKESSDGEINLDAYRTIVYTDNRSNHYDFKSNVFDVNSNQIHFGSETNGGRISWDAANNAFKIEGNVYATGGITALGVSNSATTSNNVDFTFKSVTANTFNVKNSIQLSDNLNLNRYGDDVYLASDDGINHEIYLDSMDQYYLSSNGDAYLNNLNCDILNFAGVDNFEIVDANDTGFSIQFNYNGKTYKFFPSESWISVS